MAGAVVVGDEVHPRLDHYAPVTVRTRGVGDRGDDLGVVRPSESMSGPDRNRSHRPPAVWFAFTPATYAWLVAGVSLRKSQPLIQGIVTHVTFRVRVDPDQCQGHNRCYSVSPEP